MSLINDALRKAQTDVVRGPVNPAPAGLAGAHVRPQKPNPLFRIAGVVLFVGVSVWAVSLFLSSSGETQPVAEIASTGTVTSLATAPVVEAIPLETPVQATPVMEAPVVSQAPVVEPAASIVAPVPVVAESVPPPAPVAEAPQVTQASAPAVAVVVEAAVEATPTPVPAAIAPAIPPATDSNLKDEIIFTLKQLEITAVMGDGSKARIMSGGQIHRAGELINLDLKIRFEGKKGKTLLFTDAFGKIYEKAL